MNNVKSVMNYFDGNFLFNLYLKNIIGNTNDESYMYEDNLLNDINKNAVIMGCICNIMTSIKDVILINIFQKLLIKNYLIIF